MSDEQTNGDYVARQNDATNLQLSSSLLQRGLDDLDNKKTTLEDIRKARQERPELSGLTEEAVLLVLEQPTLWKGRLFLQVMDDEIQKYRYMRLHSPRQHVSNERLLIENRSDFSKILDWCKAKTSELKGTITELSNVVQGETFQKTLNTSSEQATDAAVLIMSAVEMGLVYRQLCVWQVKIKFVTRNSKLDRLCEATAAMADEALKELENYPPRGLAKITEMIALPKTNEPVNVNLALNISLSEAAADAVHNELERLLSSL